MVHVVNVTFVRGCQKIFAVTVFTRPVCLPRQPADLFVPAGNTKGGSITVPLTSCLTGLD
jgi:hypothetical protein